LLGLVEEGMHPNNYFIGVFIFLVCPFMCSLGEDKAKKKKREGYNKKSRYVVTFVGQT
jgi:hypothetical protein